MGKIIQWGLGLALASNIFLNSCSGQQNQYAKNNPKEHVVENNIDKIKQEIQPTYSHLDSLLMNIYNQKNKLTTKEVNKTFHQTINTIDKKQEELKQLYAQAKTDSSKEEIISQAKQYLTTTFLEDIVPAWEGTSWDFYGYTSTPRKGDIACGWFVERTLENLGYHVKRKNTGRLAQQWPQTIIQGASNNEEIILTKNEKTFSEQIKKLPRGIYLVGFGEDNEQSKGTHVGYLIHSKNRIDVIHSIGSVYASPAEQEGFFLNSTKLFLGEAFSDNQVQNWLTTETYEW